MSQPATYIFGGICAAICYALVSCSGAAGQASKSNTYSVSVSVVGLLGSDLLLQNNGDKLAIATDGVSRFNSNYASNTTYLVTVARQPIHPQQLCSVEHASGTVGSADVSDVVIHCIDNIVPTLTLATPSANSTEVDTDSSITVMFDDPIDPSTIGANSFIVYNEKNEVVAGAYDFPSTTQARFTPRNPWHLSSTVRVSLTPSITDKSGNALADTLNWQFNTRDGAWTTNAYSLDGEIRTGYALDNGDFNVIWYGGSLCEQAFTHKTRSWSQPNCSPLQGQSPSYFAQAPGNTTFVGPVSFYFEIGPISAFSLINGVWGSQAKDISMTSLPFAGQNKKNFPCTASNSAGNVIVAWEQSGSFDIQTRANVYGKTGWNNEAYQVSTIRSDSTAATCAIDDSGNALVFWQEGDLSMRARRYSAVTGWEVSSATMGKPRPGAGAATKLAAFDRSGNAIAAWTHDNSTGSDISAIYYQNMAPVGWLSTGGVTVQNPLAQKPSNPSLHFDQSGNGSLLWEEPIAASPINRVLKASYFPATTKVWSTLPASLPIADYEYRVITWDSGEFVVVFGKFGVPFSRLYVATFKGGAWSPATPITQQLPSGYVIDRAALANNTAQTLAVWSIHDPNSSNGGSVWVNFYSNNAWYPDPVVIQKPTSAKIAADSVNAVLDDAGNALVTWGVELGLNSYDLYAARYSRGVWQNPAKLNTSPVPGMRAQLYVGKLGEVTATWFEGGKSALKRFE